MTNKNFASFSDYDLPSSIRLFLGKQHNNFINGKWIESVSGKTYEKLDPATNDAVAIVTESGEADVDLAVAAARKAFDESPWRHLPSMERQNILLRFADLIEQNSEELKYIECLDNGRSMALPSEAGMLVGFSRYYAGLATKITGETMRPTILMPGMNEILSYTIRQPVGVVAAITPWNGPSLSFVGKVVPAVAMGCTVVIKPSAATPLCASRLMELLQEAGIPDGVVNMIQGPGSVAGNCLVSDSRINKITFTGSTEIGKSIGRAAVENLTRVTLELGGKSPSIIFDDAEIETAALQASQSIYANCGQICVAGSRLFVQKKKFDEVISKIQQRSESMKIGPGMDPSADMGPLINTAQKQTVLSYIKKGLDSGAELVTGGNGIDRPGNFVEPTVFVHAADDSPIYKEEIFGPVLVATPFDDIEDVVRMGNDTIYGLAANIWSSNIKNALRTAHLLDAGMITVNGSTLPPDPALPFGGFKQSGMGRENGGSAVEYHTELKTISVIL